MQEKFKLLEQSLKALLGENFNLLICKGEAGFGKSHRVKEFLKENDVSHAWFSSYATPLKFYDLLHENKDKEVIVFDDVQSIDNNLIKGMLKSACWSVLNEKRKVSYYTTSEAIKKLGCPEEFEINANIILIYNYDMPDYAPLISRGLTIDINFSFKEKIQILEELREKANIYEEVLDYIKKYCTPATENLSIRTAVILSKLLENDYDWKMFAREMFKVNEDKALLIDLVAKSHKIKDACMEWTKQTGKHRATFFRYKKQIEN